MVKQNAASAGLKSKWLIYGAYGYSGELIAREAVRRNLKPILAGRSAEPLEKLAQELNLEHRTFELDEAEDISGYLKDIGVVLHCAGPFSKTSQPMLNACLKARSHYLDITGEISVFEAIQARNPEIVSAGIIAIPGVGFDVVPTDCLAAMLKDALPDANQLRLAIKGIGGKLSGGTAKTMIESLGKGGAIRKDGKITKVPTAYKTLSVDFGSGKEDLSITFPWGDVSTAYYSTGIPNIEVYFAVGKKVAKKMRKADRFGWLLRSRALQFMMKTWVELTVKGPSQDELDAGKIDVWGEVENAQGLTKSLRMQCPQGYKLTADSAVTIVEKLLSPEIVTGITPGFITPSKAFGKDFALSLAGVRLMQLAGSKASK
jgi:short subunit dehydrogenase-like uncharacterized protein